MWCHLVWCPGGAMRWLRDSTHTAHHRGEAGTGSYKGLQLAHSAPRAGQQGDQLRHPPGALVLLCLTVTVLAVTRCSVSRLTMSRCHSLSLAVSHCISLYLAVTHCVSLYLAVSRCISLCLTVTHCVSLSAQVSKTGAACLVTPYLNDPSGPGIRVTGIRDLDGCNEIHRPERVAVMVAAAEQVLGVGSFNVQRDVRIWSGLSCLLCDNQSIE